MISLLFGSTHLTEKLPGWRGWEDWGWQEFAPTGTIPVCKLQTYVYHVAAFIVNQIRQHSRRQHHHRWSEYRRDRFNDAP